MESEANSYTEVSLVGWATPSVRWFNFFPHKFNERKATQVQTLVDELEAEGIQILEFCKNPFTTSVKIVDTKET